MCREPYALWRVPNHFKTQEMCEKAIEEDPWALRFIPDHFKTKNICEKSVEDESKPL